MKGFKNKPAVLPAAEPSAAKFGEDEAAPETRGETRGEAHLEGGAEGSGETGIAGHKKKRARSGLPPWLHIKPQDRWPLVRVALVVVLCISAGWYFVDFYGGKDAQAGQALPGGGAVTSASASRSGARGTAPATPEPAPSASVKWTPTAQEAKKRAEALSVPLPAKPEGITQNTDDGAVATAKYAIELYNYTYATGNVNEYKSLCVSEKRSCVKTVASVQRLHSKGGWVSPINVVFTEGYVRKDAKDVVVQLRYYQPEAIEYSGTGERKLIASTKCVALLTLKYDGTEWKVEVIYIEDDK
jgi:hypothetical protein